MSLRETIARALAPELKDIDEIKALVTEEIKRSQMQMPINYNYDPKGEGYRPLSGTILLRNLFPVQQLRMFEIAYYMFDASAMFRRLAVMDKGFMFSGDISVNSTDSDAQDIIKRFWDDPENNMALKYPDKAMWLSILGEQCWPVNVNPANGFVRLQYVDPSLIKEVWVNPLNTEQIQRVDVGDVAGRPGPKYAVIRKDYNINSKTYDRLVGDCFFLSINHPPNSPRGRSDFLTLFDWIDSLERYGYNYLELGSTMSLLNYDTLELKLDRDIRPFRLMLVDDIDAASATTDPYTMLFGAPTEYKVDAYTHGGDNNQVVVEYSKDAGTTWLPIADITAETGAGGLAQVIFKVTLTRDPGERSPEFEFLRVRSLNQFVREPFIYISRTRNPKDAELEKQGIKIREAGVSFWTLLDFELPSRCFVRNTTKGNPFYGDLFELFDFNRSYFDNMRYRQVFSVRALTGNREIFSKVLFTNEINLP